MKRKELRKLVVGFGLLGAAILLQACGQASNPATSQTQSTQGNTSSQESERQNMDKIDKEVISALEESTLPGETLPDNTLPGDTLPGDTSTDNRLPDGTAVRSAVVQVVITCSDGCESVADALVKEGAVVVGTIPEFGTMTAQIGNKHLDLLRSSDEVESVELDEEVNIDR